MSRALTMLALVAAAASLALAREAQPVRKATDSPALSIAGGKGSARLFLDGTAAPVAFDELAAQAGTVIPPHTHDASDEILYILDGRGTTVIGGKRYRFEPGDVIHIQKGVEHSVTVETALKALQVYAPAGPEQRFKQPEKAGR